MNVTEMYLQTTKFAIYFGTYPDQSALSSALVFLQ